MSLARLKTELHDIRNHQKLPENWHIDPVDDDMHGIFLLDVHFSESYPFQAPKISFRKPIYHCNVNIQTGEIESKIFENFWSPALTLFKALHIITAMMIDPNPNLSKNTDAADFENNRSKLCCLQRKEYDNIASLWTQFWCVNGETKINYFDEILNKPRIPIYNLSMFEDDRIAKIFRIFQDVEQNMITNVSCVILEYVGLWPKHKFIKETLKWHKWVEHKKNDCDKMYLNKIKQYNIEKTRQCSIDDCALPNAEATANTAGSIAISSLSGKGMIVIDVNLDFTIGNIKALISLREGIPLEQQRFIFNGKGLNDNKATLASYNVKLNDVLEQVIRYQWYDE